MKIITISGHAQNGKDTIAKMIKDNLELDGNKVLLTHFADLLKYICRSFFDWNGEKDEAGRHILQYVGTDVVRKKMPDFWVDFILSILKLFNKEWDYVIIPDTRFPNEISKFVDNGFDVTHIRVERTNFESPLTKEQQQHQSETALDDIKPDFCIYNDGTIEDLKIKVSDFIKEKLYE